MKKRLICLLFIHSLLMSQAVAQQDETIVFTPQWTAQAQFAGYYVAEAKGFYRRTPVGYTARNGSSAQ